MLEIICAIPESFGWALVGFATCLSCMAVCGLGKLFVAMWKERHQEEEEN